MTDTAIALADTDDMVGLHRVFRQAVGDAAQHIASVPSGDGGRAELVASYFENVLRLLHAHHHGEDLLLTPRLLQRRPEQADTITAVAAQHQQVDAALQRVTPLIDSWRTDPSADTAATLTRAMTELDVRLSEHLDAEETQVLPIAAQCITAPEWNEMPEHGLRSFDGDKLWLVLGLIGEQQSPAQRAEMAEHLPAPLAQMWNNGGARQFADYVDTLRSPQARETADPGATAAMTET